MLKAYLVLSRSFNIKECKTLFIENGDGVKGFFSNGALTGSWAITQRQLLVKGETPTSWIKKTWSTSTNMQSAYKTLSIFCEQQKDKRVETALPAYTSYMHIHIYITVVCKNMWVCQFQQCLDIINYKMIRE